MTPVDEIHRRVGRNVLAFQAIEECLRFTLPYIHPEGSKHGLDAMRRYREKHIDGRTLGPLLHEFKEALIDEPEREPLERELTALVDARNDLVHGFYRNSAFNLLAPDAATQAIAYLDDQYQQFVSWGKFFRECSLAVLSTLVHTHPQLAAEFGEHRDQLMARLPTPQENDASR